MQNTKQKTVLIGLDSAEWGVIEPLIKAGVMPNFKKIIEGGTSGKIKTLNPSFSPMLWTSVATGKFAHKHGILGFIEPDVKKKKGIKPISNSSRTCKAIWNILHHHKLKSNVIGWWPSNPVEPIHGVMVSNTFQKAVGKKNEPWPILDNTIHGIDKESLASLRVHPSDINEAIIKIFVPKAEKVDQEKSKQLQTIQNLVAETLTIKNVALKLLESTNWDFTAIYFNELDKLSHSFMPFHPPKLPLIKDELFELYYNVITATYTLYDSIIGEILGKLDATTNVIILSDHGFQFDSRRMRKRPKITADIALEHNKYGFLCMAGPAFKNGEQIFGSSLLDLTPTLLTLYGLPVAKDMDGKILSSSFKDNLPRTEIESYEQMEGDFGMLKNNTNPVDELEALQQLIELGYIDKLESNVEDQITKLKNETNYNLSCVLREAGDNKKAVEILENLYQNDVVDLRYNLDLIRIYTEEGELDKARQILNLFKKVDTSKITDYDYLEGKILLAEDELDKAKTLFENALSRHPNFINLLLIYGKLCIRTFDFDKAEKLLKHLLSIEPDNHNANHALSVVYNKTKRFDEALDYALNALKIRNNFIEAHYQLGFSFYKLEEYEIAKEALEKCILMNPKFSRARKLLINIYKDHLKDEEKYKEHLSILQESIIGEIVVVTGLPRSGTSLMMQLLNAGGLTILTDEKVMPDESNPKGYYEYEPVKNSFKDISWLNDAVGKVVKVVSPLLTSIKGNYKLKIIYMERDIHEVIESQNKMIASKGNGIRKEGDFDIRLLNTFTEFTKTAKRWIGNRNMHEVYYVSHKNLLENPEEEIKKLNLYFDGQLDEKKMLPVVDPSLYRVKNVKNV